MYAAYIGAAWGPTYEIDEYLTSAHPQTYAVSALPQWTAGAQAGANWGGSTNGVTKDTPSDLVADAALFAGYINTSASGLTVDEKPATASGGGRGLFPASIQRASVPAFTAPVPDFTGDVNQTFSALSRTCRRTSSGARGTPSSATCDHPVGGGGGREGALAKALQVTEQQLLSYAKTAGYSVEG